MFLSTCTVQKVRVCTMHFVSTGKTTSLLQCSVAENLLKILTVACRRNKYIDQASRLHK